MGPKTSTPRGSVDDRLDAILHALSDRTRRTLLKRLSRGPTIVGDLAAPFAMTRIAVAKHLRVLEDAGLLSRTAEGRARRCALNAAPLRDVERWLSAYRSFWTDTLESLADYVETSAPVIGRARRKK